MIQWFSVGQEARGVVAIGQVATGVFALGQIATGVVAVGQGARGFIAIGQGAIGVVAVGMGSVGLVWSVGMVGVGGRGFGLVLPLVPSFGPKLAVPETVPAARLLRGEARAGYVEGALGRDDAGPVLRSGGKVVEARFDARLRAAVEQAGEKAVYAHLSRTETGWVCDELIEVPDTRWRNPRWWAWWAFQLAGLAAVTVVFWLVAGIPVIQALFNPGGILAG